jgi:hypothetical protein
LNFNVNVIKGILRPKILNKNVLNVKYNVLIVSSNKIIVPLVLLVLLESIHLIVFAKMVILMLISLLLFVNNVKVNAFYVKMLKNVLVVKVKIEILLSVFVKLTISK